MHKYRSLILLFLMSALFLAPLKLPSCPKQNVTIPAAVSVALTPCSVQQVMNNSCFSASYWIQDEFHLGSLWSVRSLIGILAFLLIYSKYNSPMDEIYRPPI
ncbi:hypothetical protein OQJ18_03245 [Fluoribacter dumoffii]|uniref:Uncharacterized protein n=1 Tax=Fluoribacter dumoffii TaxID=463 RepID=A0A377GBI2_9GAMM|nr:hypothetical protein [Fluoribacter dumoffii]KTC88938.1 hypothetical protein Ldum_3196 [Fluoribacter dumoffii NY 23]MCW8385850.1 hypothetical protein [Fluoribacter dumoffii]MCW8418903.1 hypothetical protein [Fluoribacter dumoffii]MCW8453253.1 hypothetical protein [Fluoribacter dumoffii]MCW8459526.1 hypothetical protein [Fluoribacter dumoffii]